ncbi:mitochondrial ATPase complex subunit ATP10 [Marinoscillum sp. MHG1-6]|uniref:mitochondrial ATPase complex subunit ATP10 n=1 Tax=Marinoscillum sp. MHG1-6 TaxID=2959627 RepID=UPI0021589861|nr:mitochondrial ATPase complex subunit ATP10 [Marinoscillum sp. MHG1-6]
MLKKFIIPLLFGLVCVAQAQTGDMFPNLDGESLVHGAVNIPEDTKGKYTLIGLAFSKKSETDLKGWFNPVYQQLIKEPSPNELFAMDYDVNVFFVPMLTGAKRPAYEQVMKKVEEDVDKQLHPHVLFYKGTLKEYKDALGIDDKNLPYFYLLDDSGKIVYATSGGYSDRKMQKIVDLLPF